MKTNINIVIKLLVLSAAVLFFNNSIFAQKQLQSAKELMSRSEYAQAIKVYKDFISTSSAGIQEKRDLAECYLATGNTIAAEEWLAEVADNPDHTAQDVLKYANVLKSNGKYSEAMIQYQDYGKMQPAESSKAKEMVNACKKSLEWIADPAYTDVINADAMNSENSDFGLMPYENGFLLTSDRRLKGKSYSASDIYGWTGNPYLKIIQYKEKDLSIAPRELEGVNNNYHNGPAVYDKHSGTLYFTRTKMVKMIKKPMNCDPTSWYDNSKAKDYVNRLELYYATKEDGKFQQPVAFQYSNPESHSVGHPALSPNGKIMYFVSDMPGGMGGTDIYYCDKFTDGTWGTPKNAGNNINTAGNEVFPYIAADGTLYFSSDGWPGMGGLDLFSAKGSKENWSTPENLKYPINSPKDDFCMVYTGEGTGYLSSNRDGGKGNDDIYRFIPSPPKTFVFTVTAKEKTDSVNLGMLKNATVQVVGDSGECPVLFEKNGVYYFRADCGKEYKVKGSRDGYFAAEKVITTTCQTRNDTVPVELVLDKIVINKPIVLNNIYYDYDKWDIRPDAAIELDKLVKILIENPKINIELGSHTDSRGKDKYNLDLSQKRAESAVNYIISKGIDQVRIKAKGYGETVPVNKCIDGVTCTEEEFQLNRRTEFKVTSISGGQK
ncbi:MAG TPA: OmpA family protein [Bacteroidales bacterium]|nr:OmpA family protein [Bacteroidales bacterium]HQI70051.1 OmpA family protein [Bacteroidales bacterium]